MGRVFLVKFDRTPESRFHLCNTCQTHIFLFTEWTFFSDNGLQGLIVSNAVNVHTLGPEQNRRVGDRVVADVYCNNCGNYLGIKFIEVRNDDAQVKDTDFLLRTSKLLFWDGTEVV